MSVAPVFFACGPVPKKHPQTAIPNSPHRSSSLDMTARFAFAQNADDGMILCYNTRYMSIDSFPRGCGCLCIRRPLREPEGKTARRIIMLRLFCRRALPNFPAKVDDEVRAWLLSSRTRPTMADPLAFNSPEGRRQSCLMSVT